MSSCRVQSRPIVIFSGLGGDERLLDPQRESGLEILTPTWLEPEDGETLREYARRWSKRLDIPDGCVLGGISFGGMLACELTQYFNPGHLVLISSCRSSRALPRLYVQVETWLRGIPDGWVRQPIIRLHPLVHRILDDITPQQQQFLMSQFEGTPIRRLREFARMACQWSGVEKIHCPVDHIHGDKDPVILCKRAEPNRIVKGAGHLMSLTHAQQVSELLWQIAGTVKVSTSEKG